MSRTYRFRAGFPARLDEGVFARLAPGHTRETTLVVYENGYSHRRQVRCACGVFHYGAITDEAIPASAIVTELVRHGWPPRVAAARVRYHREGFAWRHEHAEDYRFARRAYRRGVRTLIASGRFEEIDPPRKARGWL